MFVQFLPELRLVLTMAPSRPMPTYEAWERILKSRSVDGPSPNTQS